MGTDARAEFAVHLNDEISGGAKSAAQALVQLKQQLQDDQAALTNMQKAMRNLQAGTVVEVDAFRKLKAAIDAKKQSIARSQAAYIQLGGNLGATTKKSSGFRDQMRQLAEQSTRMPGPLGSISTRLQGLTRGMAGAKLAAVALAGAFIAATAAAVGFLASLTKSAIVAQDARRNELLHLEALTKLRNFWGVAPGKASEMQAAIDQVSASVSISRDKVASYAETLYRAHFRGTNFFQALQGASIKASALGDAAGSSFIGWASTINRTGGSVNRLTQDVKNRFGGVVAAQMKSLEVSARKQKEAFNSLFGGLHVEAFLTAMTRLRGLFAQNTASGRVLKQLMTAVLQPLINQAEKAATFLRRFFKQMLIGAAELVLAYAIVRDKFRDAFGSPEQKQSMSWLLDKLDLGRIFTYLLVGAFVVLAAKIAFAVLVQMGELIAAIGKYVLAVATRAIPATLTMARGFGTLGGGLKQKLIPILTTNMGEAIGGLKGKLLGLGKAAGTSVVTSFAQLGTGLKGFAAMIRSTLIPALVRAIAMMWSWVAATWAALAPWLLIAGVIALAGLALWGLYKIGELVYTFFSEIDWSKGIVEGLMTGIKALGMALFDVVTDLGKGLVHAFTSVLGIASPSKVFAELGTELPAGVAQGVKTGSPQAQSAVDEMVAPRVAPVGAAEGGAPSGSAAARSVQVSIGELHITSAADKPREFADALRREIEAVLEGVALQLGTRPAGAV